MIFFLSKKVLTYKHAALFENAHHFNFTYILVSKWGVSWYVFALKEYITRNVFLRGFLEFNMYKKRLKAFNVLKIPKSLVCFFAFNIRAFSLKISAAKTSRDMPVT